MPGPPAVSERRERVVLAGIAGSVFLAPMPSAVTLGMTVVGLAVAGLAPGCAFLVPAREARNLALAREPAGPIRT
jgi:hypothetical protein